ncbi:MAG TPA: rhodanese-like domain-containing protein [Pontiella sp.]|nr:rhodanese-like domain-containing protein [Pontiella sp.]
MKASAKRIGVLLLAGALAAVTANSLNPRRIPWVQDWSGQVEAQAAEQDIQMISRSDAFGKLHSAEVLFVDARPAEHFARGHIAGAVSAPFDQFDERFSVIVDLIDSGCELVIYCTNRECDDALLLAIELKSMGCTNAVLYVDGFEGWKKHGGATTSSPVDAVPPPTGTGL